jgi:DNA modification methylase
MTAYTEFLKSKRLVVPSAGRQVSAREIHPKLFDFQRDITRWALRKGRAAIFADCGLGKTFCQLEWARLVGGRALIVAPLSVARQTVGEAAKLGLEAHYTRSGDDLTKGINITNYEMVERFDASDFASVVLDESSILKGLDGKTRRRVTEMFAETPYRLCCTATPAPNDIAEIANHAEFLGIMTRAEMLAAFFVHDDKGWRLKGHAREGFFRWLASWGMSIRKPSDLGYSDEGFILPDLDIRADFVRAENAPEGQLFWGALHGLSDRIAARRATIRERVQRAAELINSNNEQWIAWVGLNNEGRLLAQLVPDSVLQEGADSPDKKLGDIEAFQDGRVRVLVTKPRIAGFGMNLQNCANMVFVGLGDSYEQYYQCVRRCWRFGQTKPVTAHIVLTDMEAEIRENVLRKEAQAAEMTAELLANVSEFERAEIADTQANFEYAEDTARGDGYMMMLGDSAEKLREIDDESIGLSVFSPPFISLYTYSPTERDLGNCRTEDEFFGHFGFIIDELLRVTMPGRNCCVHVAQVPAMLSRDGYIGLKDFRGQTIQAFEQHGWVYHGEVCIDKCPQVQAIRTKSKALLFVQLKKDASWLRPALADYILVFRKPGDNPVPIQPDITNDEWIEWARPVWYGIRETDTLNAAAATETEDERHICPLQLGTIERCVRLWSNPGETILSPFAGIGSEGYVALKTGRQFVGIELKPSYWQTARGNLERALSEGHEVTLFDNLGGA